MRHVLKGEEGGGGKEGRNYTQIHSIKALIHMSTIRSYRNGTTLIYCTHIRVFDRQVHVKIIPRTVSQPPSKARICLTNVNYNTVLTSAMGTGQCVRVRTVRSLDINPISCFTILLP